MTGSTPYLPQVLIVAYVAGAAACWAYLAAAVTSERRQDPAGFARVAARLAARGTSHAQEILILAVLWPWLLHLVTAHGYDHHPTTAGAERAPARKATRDDR